MRRHSKRSRHSRKVFRAGGTRHSTHIDNSEQRLRGFTARLDARLFAEEQENRLRTLAHRRMENNRLTRRRRNGTHHQNRRTNTRH